ncbi:MAG: hypothetical protein IT294_16275 [Deltaproteobacteria bacterium]|nr:hypothetical protein [Deltaproteobacteria bacterium]
MATKTQLRFTIAIAVALAAVSVAMPDLALAGHRHYRGAPEVDPSTLSSAIALALGGVAILRDKFRR